MYQIAFIIATGFGLGLLKPAPGTWGSLGALVSGLLIYYYGGPIGLALATLIITAIGMASSHVMTRQTGIEDDPRIVIDEIAGQFLALIPAGLNITLVICAFLLFRFFDITKPWPARRIDKNWPGAPGIMFDDLIAGLYTAIAIIGLHYAGFG